MKLLMRAAALLYPSQWRARYGAELAALLEDSGGGCGDLWDLCKGAIAMQMLRGNVWKLIGLCAVAGLLLGGLVAWRMPSEYRSTAVMRLPGGQDDAIEGLTKAEQHVLSRSSLAEIVNSYGLYPEERKKLPLEDIVQDVRNRRIQIRMLTPVGTPNGTAFSMSFDYTDPSKAKAVNDRLVAKITGAMQGLELLDPASVPNQAFSPNRPVILVVGLLLGIAAAVLLMGIRLWPMVAGVGLIVAIVALPASFVIPNRYLSSAVLKMSGGDPAAAVNEVMNNGAFLQSLITEDRLYPGDPDALGKMRRSLRVRQLGLPRARWSAIEVEFHYADRYKAQQAVRDIVARFGTLNAAQIEVLDPPSLPETAYFPNRLVIVFCAGVGGLLLGAILMALRRRRPPMLHPA